MPFLALPIFALMVAVLTFLPGPKKPVPIPIKER